MYKFNAFFILSNYDKISEIIISKGVFFLQAIIFDFDGTLADSEKCSILATQNAFKKFDLTIPTTKQISYYMGIPIEKSFHEMASEPLSKERFEQLLTAFRAEYKRLEPDTLRLFPHVSELLEKLQQREIPCFVLSSKHSNVLQRNLQTLEISHYITACIGSDLVQHYKPHPDGIFILRDTYQLSLENCLMVGDAIFDLQMGKVAGTKTCAVSWGSHSKEKLLTENPDYYLENMLDLLPII